ncbi:hypothetical protein BS17DRAFT_762442 [Gyrodon lividus]|nr:hypothetical protein BS17DRAFT_762442 [Gyrodon lividus]
MALNDRNPTLGEDRGTNVPNPTHTDPVTEPSTKEKGAGARPAFKGDKDTRRSLKETASVVEGQSGIIESTHIDPLNEASNQGAGIGGDIATQGVKELLFNVTEGAANVAHGVAIGDKGITEAGKQALGLGRRGK